MRVQIVVGCHAANGGRYPPPAPQKQSRPNPADDSCATESGSAGAAATGLPCLGLRDTLQPHQAGIHGTLAIGPRLANDAGYLVHLGASKLLNTAASNADVSGYWPGLPPKCQLSGCLRERCTL